MKRRYVMMTLLVAAIAAVSACNIFKPLDSPGEGEQALSVARACFDRGDFECAKENYEKVTGDLKDQADAEKAFLVLDEIGADMGAFLGAFGGGDIGAGITALSNTVGKGADEDRRNEIFDAYKSAMSIGDKSLRNFARFVTSMALTAELLAESNGGTGALKATDIAASAQDCANGESATCAADTNCGVSLTASPGLVSGDSSDGLKNDEGKLDLSQDSVTKLEGDPSVRMVYASLREVFEALDGIGAGGDGIGGGTLDGVDAIINNPDLDAASQLTGISADDAFAQCFRQMILQQKIGDRS